jgi:hypothetical protein
MESGQITAIVLASLICATITIGVIAQAWLTRRERGSAIGSSPSTRLEDVEARLYRLEQAIDTVAVEVERGAEAQRFTAKLLAERFELPPSAGARVRNGER